MFGKVYLPVRKGGKGKVVHTLEHTCSPAPLNRWNAGFGEICRRTLLTLVNLYYPSLPTYNLNSKIKGNQQA